MPIKTGAFIIIVVILMTILHFTGIMPFPEIREMEMEKTVTYNNHTYECDRTSEKVGFWSSKWTWICSNQTHTFKMNNGILETPIQQKVITK